MKINTIIPLVLMGFCTFAQDHPLVSGTNFEGNCLYKTSEAINKTYPKARLFYYSKNQAIRSEEVQINQGNIKLSLNPSNSLILVKLFSETENDHFWIELDSTSLKNQLNMANAYAGEFVELTGLITSDDIAYQHYQKYKSGNEAIDDKLYNEFYWKTMRNKDGKAILPELSDRTKYYANAEEYPILMRSLIALGDTIYSEKLANDFGKRFPNSAEAVEVNTWDLRKSGFLTKDGNECYQIYKEYQKQVAPIKGKDAIQRIENHKAQFLIRLYDFYKIKGHLWTREVQEFSPQNQVYVYGITASNQIDKNPFEAMDLIDMALAVSDEKLIASFKKNNDHNVYLDSELKQKALQCKDLPYYLQGKIHLNSEFYDEAVQSFKKAAELNSFEFNDYYEAYLDALITTKDTLAFLETVEKVSKKHTIAPKYQELIAQYKHQEKSNQSTERLAIEKLPIVNFDTKNGAKINSESFKDKVVILDFWTSDCKECIQAFPGMYYLQKVYESESVKFYTINLDALAFEDKAFKASIFNLEERGYGEFTQLFDYSSQARVAFSAKATPCKIIIAPDQSIRYFQNDYKGINQIEEIEQIITTLLKENKKPSK